MYIIISQHTESYKPLTDLTWEQNKIPYAALHGYKCECEILTEIGHSMQLRKVNFINRLLNENPDAEWIWWTGGDLMVTNFTTKIEDKIDNNYHMIIATDCNGLNADSILIRNSDESKQYWRMIADELPKLAGHWEGEQKVIKDTFIAHKHMIKVVPQREINAYNYTIYGSAYKGAAQVDYLGTNGNWQQGDWAIHWPGTSLEARVQMATYYTGLITK